MAGSGGSIRRHPHGGWEGRFSVDGRRRSVWAGTKAECQRKLRQAIESAEHGIKPTPQRLTVAQYLDEWLQTSVRSRCRPATVKSYTDTVERHLKPAIGRHPLAKLEPTHVARMLTDLPAHLSPTTRRYTYTVLRIALGRAVKQQLVVRNVATLVDPPQKARREMRPLSAEQTRAFLASVVDDPHEALYTVALATGMRQGELLGLRWQDVDLETRTLAVRHTLARGTYTLGEPKTAAGKRTIRLAATAAEVLRRHKVAQLEERIRVGRKWQDLGFVFTTGHGTPLDTRNVTRYFQSALRRAGLPHQRFHDLRHGYATLMIEAGEDLVVVSKSLGHADLGTTADIYAHLTPAMQERSAERMDKVLTG